MKQVLVVSLLAAVLGVPAAAQVDAPAAAKSGKPRGGSRAAVDARECLKLSTNMEIHRCAEKYR